MAEGLEVPVPAGAPARECTPVPDVVVFDHVGRYYVLGVQETVVSHASIACWVLTE